MQFRNMSHVINQLKFFLGVAIISVGMMVVFVFSLLIGMPIFAISNYATGDEKCHSLVNRNMAFVAFSNIMWLGYNASNVALDCKKHLPVISFSDQLTISYVIFICLVFNLVFFEFCDFSFWYCVLSATVCVYLSTFFWFCKTYEINCF